jgi:broad specificity phosphatase PhoE
VRLLLVRHGETEWNKLGRFQGQCDVPLNKRGLVQARQTARAVSLSPGGTVYASPLYRTMQTAHEITRAAGVNVVPMDGLKELNLGDLEGITGSEMRTDWPQAYAAWRDDPAELVMPKGESLKQLQERAWQAFLEIEAAHQEEEQLVAVSHNFAIRAIICKLLGMPLSNFHRMSLNLASICTVETGRSGRRLVVYNATGHLSPKYR